MLTLQGLRKFHVLFLQNKCKYTIQIPCCIVDIKYIVHKDVGPVAVWNLNVMSRDIDILTTHLVDVITDRKGKLYLTILFLNSKKYLPFCGGESCLKIVNSYSFLSQRIIINKIRTKT